MMGRGKPAIVRIQTRNVSRFTPSKCAASTIWSNRFASGFSEVIAKVRILHRGKNTGD
jgi:hypothetical protein